MPKKFDMYAIDKRLTIVSDRMYITVACCLIQCTQHYCDRDFITVALDSG